MAPKKAAVAVAVAVAVADSPSNDDQPTDRKDEKKTDAATVRKLAAHPSTAIMVREAIKALDSRKGVSSQAIQNYIKRQYPSVDLVRLRALVRRALKKGIESGTLVRPANATATTGATGRFRLPLKPKEPKGKSENADPNVQKAPKVEKGEAKKKKPAAKKKEPKEKSSEEPKPAKKSKKDEEDVLSKVVPPKKPKAAKKVTAVPESEEAEESEPVKPKGKAKAVKEDKEKLEKGKATQKGKVTQSKAQVAKPDEAPTKATGKRGKKASE